MTRPSTVLTIGVGDGGQGGHLPHPPNLGKYFSGKNHVKFGHFVNCNVKFGQFVNFHAYIFGQKGLAPKLTEILRLQY